MAKKDKNTFLTSDDAKPVLYAVKYFKATKNTKRFNSNQKVWITLECANHLYVRFKYRGKGRYVNGVVDKFAKYVGEIKSIEVSKDFVSRLGVSD